MDIIIREGLILYGDKPEIVRADIHVSNGKIKKISKRIRNKADIEISAKGKLVIPGLINMHTHSPMTLFRGIADDLPLMEWLKKYIWPIEKRLKPKDVYWGALLAIVEMLKTGTTTFVDMYFYMEEVAKAVKKSGIRGFLSYGMIDLGDENKRDEDIKTALKFMKFVQKLKTDRVKFLFGPHAPYTCSKELLEWVRDSAKEYGCLINIHLSETKEEVKEIKKKYGKTPVQFLDELGFLDKNIIAAHCVWLTKKDIKILKEREVTVVHNPTSNLKLASGMLPLKELLREGVRITLGTDGAASNNDLDMIEEMRIAALIHKVKYFDPKVGDTRTIFRMATVQAGKSLNMKIGSIEEGYLADIVIINLNKPHLTPMHNPLSTLIYSAKGTDVDTVIIDGNIVVENGKVLTLDEEKIMNKVRKLSERLLNIQCSKSL